MMSHGATQELPYRSPLLFTRIEKDFKTKFIIASGNLRFPDAPYFGVTTTSGANCRARIRALALSNVSIYSASGSES